MENKFISCVDITVFYIKHNGIVYYVCDVNVNVKLANVEKVHFLHTFKI